MVEIKGDSMFGKNFLPLAFSIVNTLCKVISVWFTYRKYREETSHDPKTLQNKADGEQNRENENPDVKS